jgi:glycosyltransferase involved in cell wall biosynthesis
VSESALPKIAQVMAGARYGGAETAFCDTVIALHEAGFPQIIAMRDHPEQVARLKKAGLPVHTFSFGGPFDVVTPWKLQRLFREEKPQIVQTWMGRACQKLPNVKGEKPYKVVARLGGYYKMKYFKAADFFIGNTPNIRDYVIREGINPQNAVFIPNFAPEDVLPETPLTRKEMDTDPAMKVGLCLGRYHEAKALDIAIRAVAPLPDVTLWLAGEGPDRKKLEELAKELGIAHRIKFLGWREDRGALFQAADFCLFPSRFEPFGNVAVQAWANKRPLIVSDADGPRQYVQDHEDALMVPIEDVGATTNAIRKLLSDPKLADKLVTNGYRRFKGEFSKNVTIAAYRAFYERVLLS